MKHLNRTSPMLISGKRGFFCKSTIKVKFVYKIDLDTKMSKYVMQDQKVLADQRVSHIVDLIYSWI